MLACLQGPESWDLRVIPGLEMSVHCMQLLAYGLCLAQYSTHSSDAISCCVCTASWNRDDGTYYLSGKGMMAHSFGTQKIICIVLVSFEGLMWTCLSRSSTISEQTDPPSCSAVNLGVSRDSLHPVAHLCQAQHVGLDPT